MLCHQFLARVELTNDGGPSFGKNQLRTVARAELLDEREGLLLGLLEAGPSVLFYDVHAC